MKLDYLKVDGNKSWLMTQESIPMNKKAVKDVFIASGKMERKKYNKKTYEKQHSSIKVSVEKQNVFLSLDYDTKFF